MNLNTLTAHMRRAQAEHRAGNLKQAEASYRAVLAAHPNHADALSGLAALCHQTSRSDQAADLFLHALNLRPQAPDILANLGVVLLACGRADEALTCCDKAIALMPKHAAIHDNRGNALRSLGRFGDALAAYDRAIALAPGFADAHDNRGVVLAQLKRYPEALAAHDLALSLNPNSPRAHYNRSDILLRLGRPKDALESTGKALELQPAFPEALNNRGVALLRLRCPNDALLSIDRALALRPNDMRAKVNRGLALVDLHRPDEALALYDQLRDDDLSFAHVRAAALIEMNDPGAAVAALAGAHPKEEDAAAVRTLGGFAHLKLGNVDQALEHFLAAMQLEPDNPVCQWNLANAELLAGDFEAGLPLYESRWAATDLVPPVSNPIWLGESTIAGKTLLIHTEQGYGDTIQFSRYAPLLAEAGARVLLRVQPGLKDLMTTLEGVAQVTNTDDPVPDFDLYCPVASLPLAMQTTLSSIPCSTPYLHADPELVSHWKAKLATGDAPRIGLVVSGNPQHKNDRNRSMPLEFLEPLLRRAANFTLLQLAVAPRDLPTLERHPNVTFPGPELKTYSDTAALVACLDLVISVDTSVAHLAGALGKPVWLMIPRAPDWRWLQDRTDSPWYPTARLFRQVQQGDWSTVIQSIERALCLEFGWDAVA